MADKNWPASQLELFMANLALEDADISKSGCRSQKLDRD